MADCRIAGQRDAAIVRYLYSRLPETLHDAVTVLRLRYALLHLVLDMDEKLRTELRERCTFAGGVILHSGLCIDDRGDEMVQGELLLISLPDLCDGVHIVCQHVVGQGKDAVVISSTAGIAHERALQHRRATR